MRNDTQRWLLYVLLAVAIALILCTCCTVGAGLLLMWDREQNPYQRPTPPPLSERREEESGRRLDSEIDPPPTLAPPPDERATRQAEETLNALETAEMPDADTHELGIRLLGIDPKTPRIANTESPDYPVGTKRRFTVSDVDAEERFEVEAELVYKTPHVYMWVETTALNKINLDTLGEAAELFESHTYPTTREFFGSEWTPGVDGDPHLSILHATGLGATVAGYFSSPDEYVKAVRDDSNEMEMFYINLDNIQVGSKFYNGVLAHEFQHMIHWYNDRNETTWLNEGCSELAMVLNERAHAESNYTVGGSDTAYMNTPDTQLTHWPEGTAGDASANYGGAYLFMEYFLDRFDEDATKALVSNPENGMDSVDLTLRELGYTFDHTDLFADWMIANLLDNPGMEDGQYGYEVIDPYEPRKDYRVSARDLPVQRESVVRQYGVDYVEIEELPTANYTLSFTGAPQVQILATTAYSGDYLWWSNRNDESDSTLTRIFDLTDVQRARLEFQTWYHIENDWDYGYVVVGTTAAGVIPADLTSPDITWQILDDAGLACNQSDPNGNNYGCGLTGDSGGWQQLHADLTRFAGQEIALRFEYITDAAVTQPGWALDDIAVVVDGERRWVEDAEAADESWTAAGFVRHANVLPQEWIVQAVVYGETEAPQVRSLLRTGDNTGIWQLPLVEDADRVVLLISAIAPVTTEAAPYSFTFSIAE